MSNDNINYLLILKLQLDERRELFGKETAENLFKQTYGTILFDEIIEIERIKKNGLILQMRIRRN